MDEFEIKFCNKEDAEHLINMLKTYYKVSIDWSGKHYCGPTFDWDYDAGYVDVYIPD